MQFPDQADGSILRSGMHKYDQNAPDRQVLPRDHSSIGLRIQPHKPSEQGVYRGDESGKDCEKQPEHALPSMGQAFRTSNERRALLGHARGLVRHEGH